ncbi:hypothetical protein BZG02_16295 [Labilibaculum filiforme]|uniref:alpha-L-fucosidase n=1 Tax=Labilibaculum filiforme TaxID=1940526 RepID=A0A2N3HTF9_9BACT|nr:alpha-L-fucosidase [Labilibaculum filiforme]PKQ61350.1 hypothetical protein BZG02_16295 [Labilibaculum filiforme]
MIQKRKFVKLYLLGIVFFLLMKVGMTQEYQETWESLSEHTKVPEWFKDAKMGIYFHWGVYTVPAYGGEWYSRWMYQYKESGWGSGWKEYHENKYGTDFNYHDFIPAFTGEYFDAKEWVKLFKSAGAKFAGPVAQHHDGFAMWDSQINPWNAKAKGPHKDIVGEMLRALEEENMKTITTLHHAFTYQSENAPSYFNLNHKNLASITDTSLMQFYGKLALEEGREFWLNLTNELVDKYSPDLIWFDSDLNRMPVSYLKKMTAHFFNASKNSGKETAIICKQKDLPENIRIYDIERGGMKETPEDYWMTDITISENGFGWGYIEGQKYKSVELIVRNMIDVWSKKGVVLLNVSPTAKGIINKEQREILKQIGWWLKIHNEAVYTTRTHSIYGYGIAEVQDGSHGGQASTINYSSKDIRFTLSKDGKSLYAFLLGKPNADTTIKLEHIWAKNNSAVKKVTLIENCREMEFKYFQKEQMLEVKVPKDIVFNNYASVFKIEFD